MAETLASKLIWAENGHDTPYSIGVNGGQNIQLTGVENVDEASSTSDIVNFSLQNFYDNWESFKRNSHFFFWGKGNASGNDLKNLEISAQQNGTHHKPRIKMWYNPEWEEN